MAARAAPTVFLSYSHGDLRVARRLVRRLTAHGVKVWIDERELRAGAVLSSSFRTQIQGADVLLVVASKASAVSKWVGLELDFGREQGKPILPFFIEREADNERFLDHKGVDATSPQAFADAVHDLMRDLFLSFDLELPPADPAVLVAELRELASEEPDLAPLILGCLDSEGLHQENMDTAYKAAFQPLDDALNALFDLMPNLLAAEHAAYGFCLAGAGTRALFSWIAATGDGGGPLVRAVGSKLEPALIATAIKLLAACNPPNNQALFQFIDQNAEQFDQGQRCSVLGLVTWPVRDNMDRQADLLGWGALKHFPDAVEIQQMWDRWIDTGVFDGGSGPFNLADYLAAADKEGLPGWERVNEALRSHVRGYLRSGDENKVDIAMAHVQAAAYSGAPILAALLRETNGFSDTSGWNDWKKRDRKAAEGKYWYVLELAKEAEGDQDWTGASERAEQMVTFMEQHRRSSAKDEQESNGDS